jgi:hypothetical protein
MTSSISSLRQAKFDEVLGGAHAGVGDHCCQALCFHGVAQHVAERSGFLVFPRRDQDNIALLRIVDGHLEHEVVPRGTHHRDSRPAEGHAAVDGFDPGAQGAFAALRFVDGGGGEPGKALDGAFRRAVEFRLDVDHAITPGKLVGVCQDSAWTAFSMAAMDSSITGSAVAYETRK